MTDTVLSRLQCQFCLVYFGYLAVFSTMFEENIKGLQTVLEPIRTAGVTLQPEKRQFAYELAYD